MIISKLSNCKINPISHGEGGWIYRKCHVSLKISRFEVRSGGHGVSKFKLGHKRPNKKGFGSEIFWADPGVRKVRPAEHLCILKFLFLLLWTKFRDQKPGKWTRYGLYLQNIGSHNSNTKDLSSFGQKMTAWDRVKSVVRFAKNSKTRRIC